MRTEFHKLTRSQEVDYIWLQCLISLFGRGEDIVAGCIARICVVVSNLASWLLPAPDVDDTRAPAKMGMQACRLQHSRVVKCNL